MQGSFQPTMERPPVTTGVTRALRTPDRLGGSAGTRARKVDHGLAWLLQRTVGPARVRVELWDGSSPSTAPSRPVGDMVVLDRGTLLGLILNPDIWFGEAYMAGRLDIRGPLEPVLEALSGLSLPTGSWRDRLATAMAIPNTLSDARRNVHHHYDLGNDFYALWLDRELVYTCAFFDHPEVEPRNRTEGQAGSRLSQAAAATGRHCGRGRLRLGRLGPAYGATLRRACHRVQRVRRATRVRTSAGRTRTPH